MVLTLGAVALLALGCLTSLYPYAGEGEPALAGQGSADAALAIVAFALACLVLVGLAVVAALPWTRAPRGQLGWSLIVAHGSLATIAACRLSQAARVCTG